MISPQKGAQYRSLFPVNRVLKLSSTQIELLPGVPEITPPSSLPKQKTLTTV